MYERHELSTTLWQESEMQPPNCLSLNRSLYFKQNFAQTCLINTYNNRIICKNATYKFTVDNFCLACYDFHAIDDIKHFL